MEIESRKCINISKIVEYLSELTLRQSHTVTGFDTTSFLHGVGEIKVPKMSKWKRKTQASKGNRCFMLKSLFKLFATPEKKKTV